MNGFGAAQARLDYSAHYGPADGDGWWKDQAEDELWSETAPDYASENADDILGSQPMGDLLERAIRASVGEPTDETLRGFGAEMVEIVRAYCASKAKQINERSVMLAEAYRREARDFMRGGE